MGKPNASLDLTFNDLERPKSRSLRFERYVYREGVQLDHTLLSNSNKKSYRVIYGKTDCTIRFDIQ